MHIPHPPICKKVRKRKASITSIASDEAQLAESSPAKQKKAKIDKETEPKTKARASTPEAHPLSPPPSRSLSRSVSPDRIASASSQRQTRDTMLRKTHVLYLHLPSTLTDDISRSTATSSTSSASEPETAPTPRRSSRLKKSISNISEAWNKARPYVERMNGTFVPLDHKSPEAYQGRDGVKSPPR